MQMRELPVSRGSDEPPHLVRIIDFCEAVVSGMAIFDEMRFGSESSRNDDVDEDEDGCKNIF